MDIANLTTGERIVEIKHPVNRETNLGLRVGLIALSDPRMKNIRRSIIDQRQRLESRGKFFKADDIEENRNTVVFGAMTFWQWYKVDKDGNESADGEQCTFRGSVPDFNKPNVVAVFTALPWVRDQLDEALSEEQDFFEKSAAS